jgi:hypothetical protein
MIVSSAATLVDVTSAAMDAIPDGSFPSLLVFDYKGNILTEIICKSTAGLESFKQQFESTVPGATIKPLSTGDRHNILGRTYYRGIYSGNVQMSGAAGANGAITYLDYPELSKEIRRIFSGAGLRVSTIDRGKGPNQTTIHLRATGKSSAALDALTTLADAKLNVIINKSNISFDTKEPISDHVVLTLTLEFVAGS